MRIKPFLLTLFYCSFFTMSSTSFATENTTKEEVTDLEESGDWASAQACTVDSCMWRAMTLCLEDPAIRLMVVNFKDESPVMAVMYDDAPLSQVSEWGDEPVPIKIKVRVDQRETYALSTELHMFKEDREMVFRLDFDDQTEKVLADMKAGNTLRLRLYGENGNVTIPFSLKGATKSINRVLHGFDKQPFKTVPDPYFDDRN